MCPILFYQPSVSTLINIKLNDINNCSKDRIIELLIRKILIEQVKMQKGI